MGSEVLVIYRRVPVVYHWSAGVVGCHIANIPAALSFIAELALWPTLLNGSQYPVRLSILLYSSHSCDYYNLSDWNGYPGWTRVNQARPIRNWINNNHVGESSGQTIGVINIFMIPNTRFGFEKYQGTRHIQTSTSYMVAYIISYTHYLMFRTILTCWIISVIYAAY